MAAHSSQHSAAVEPPAHDPAWSNGTQAASAPHQPHSADSAHAPQLCTASGMSDDDAATKKADRVLRTVVAALLPAQRKHIAGLGTIDQRVFGLHAATAA